MAFKLVEAAQARWRAVNAPYLVALVRAGARFANATWSNDPTNQEARLKQRDTQSTGLDNFPRLGCQLGS
jgi:putative transposase